MRNFLVKDARYHGVAVFSDVMTKLRTTVAIVAASTSMIGCGRVGFDSVLLSNDATMITDIGNGNHDGKVDAAAGSLFNVVFLSSATYTGNLGGIDGANNLCQGLAGNRWPGLQFIALLSDGSAYSAVALLQGSRGWIRPDGVAVADEATTFAAQAILNPIDIDENQRRVPDAKVWSGYQAFMAPSSLSCAGFSATGAVGAYGNVSLQAGSFASGNAGCIEAFHLVCISKGRNTPLPTLAPIGPRVFLSASTFAPGPGLSRANADTICQSEADNAGLKNILDAPAKFRALLPTTGTRAIDVTPQASAQHFRIDGSPVGPLSTFPLRTFISQRATGVIDGPRTVWTGGSFTSVGVTTCGNWSINTNLAVVGTSQSSSFQSADSTSLNCGTAANVYCVEVP
jgi:trimeric autotransporter adhesin